LTVRYEAERLSLRSLLLRWQSGEVSESQVHEQAERIWALHRWPEVPPGDPGSIVTEIAQTLESLNVQWVVVEDVPAILSFLETLAGNELDGWSAWQSYWGAVDFTAREHSLKSNPYYSGG
jgi:hypothetical protein